MNIYSRRSEDISPISRGMRSAELSRQAPHTDVFTSFLYAPLLLLSAGIEIICRPVIKRCLLAVVLLDIPLQWGIHLDFRPHLSALGSIGGYDVSITTIALLGLYISWLFTCAASHQRPRFYWNWPIVVYTFAVGISTLVSTSEQLAYFYLFILAQLLLVYFYIRGNLGSRDDIVFVLAILLVGGVFEGAYMLLLGAIGNKLGLVPASTQDTLSFSFLGLKTMMFMPVKDVPFVRQGGTIGSPTYAAGYLGVIITLAVCVRQMKVPRYLRRLTLPAIVLGGLALVTTFSRGGWIEIVIAVVILLCAKWIRGGVSTATILSMLGSIALIGLLLYTPNPVSDRLMSPDNGSAESRIPLMHLAFHMIAAHPVLGVGANNFADVMERYAGPEFRYAWIYTVHNQFLLVWAETGLIGLLAYISIYTSIIRKGWRLWRSRDNLLAPLGIATIAGTIGLMSHMLVDIFSERALLQLFWIIMAILEVGQGVLVMERAERTELSSPVMEAW
jgi:O-antigen ligase